MKLGTRSRVLLDVILTASIDALDFAAFPKRHLYDVGGWSDDRAARRRLRCMRDKGWIVWNEAESADDWVLKLTKEGRDVLREGVDPEDFWARSWDGKWRLIAFDLPVERRKSRRELLAWLHSKRFGKLQESLWVSPDFRDEWTKELELASLDPREISFIEGHSFAGSDDLEFVKKAWRFGEINAGYRRLLDFHAKVPGKKSEGAIAAWIRAENAIWRDVFEKDPFLPDSLLPNGYLGKRALAARKAAYSKALS
ncbi:MAG: PaaX family transcriptional regulator C-terminal domain-containing protein [Verrucomicrobiota bacterium]